MKRSGDPLVRAWLDSQVIDLLFLSATSLSELLIGIGILPAGQRKENLSKVLETVSDRLFQNRVVAFDEKAAVFYASLVALARSEGYIVSMQDGQIAAIAAVHGFTVATRDVAPFQAAGVPVLSPREE